MAIVYEMHLTFLGEGMEYWLDMA